jgi:hypothetical protein
MALKARIQILVILVILAIFSILTYANYQRWLFPKEIVSEKITPKKEIPPEKELIPETEAIIPEEKSEEKPIGTPEKVEQGITCQNECPQTGLKRCSDNGHQSCGNYDADTCLEWSLITNCPLNTICQNGICVQQIRPSTIYNYYDYCWDYDCDSKYPPFPKLTKSQKPGAIKVDFRYLPANGTVNIIIVFLYGYEPLPDEYINILKAPENDVRSFKYAAKWFKEESKQYGVNLDININFSQSQLKLPEDYIIQTYQESLSSKQTKYLKENFPQFNSYDVIVPFYYGSTDFSFANHVSGKNSFELYCKQYAPGIFYPDFTEDSTHYSMTFAHELAHLFGATDKYTCQNISSESCIYAKEQGIGCWIESDNPNALGKDIMCHRVPRKYDGGWEFLEPSLNELVIIDATAKEIGWYDADRDGILEVNDPSPFD